MNIKTKKELFIVGIVPFGVALFALMMFYSAPKVGNQVSTVNQEVAQEIVIEEPHNEFINQYSEEGIASFYGYESCTNPKCLMANGLPLDLTKNTVAFMKAPLGSMVKIINPANHKSVIAEVTDTGGFNHLGRIIDLNEKVKNDLGCSDLCTVVVYW